MMSDYNTPRLIRSRKAVREGMSKKPPYIAHEMVKNINSFYMYVTVYKNASRVSSC